MDEENWAAVAIAELGSMVIIRRRRLPPTAKKLTRAEVRSIPKPLQNWIKSMEFQYGPLDVFEVPDSRF